jgi:hypothetical protein
MQREPGKRDYGSSDGARLRSLASRGIPVNQAAPKPATPTPPQVRDPREHRVRPRPERHARA